MTTREAARPLRRYMRARVRAASLAPTYTITRDVTRKRATDGGECSMGAVFVGGCRRLEPIRLGRREDGHTDSPDNRGKSQGRDPRGNLIDVRREGDRTGDLRSGHG